MKKLLLAKIFVLTNIFAFTQTYLVNEQFTTTTPVGWSTTTPSGWAVNNYGVSNARSGTYALRLSSASANNGKYVYIPINVQTGYSYSITFWTKRICSTTINTNETLNQTTLLSTFTQTNSSCNSNWNTWYQWSTTYVSTYTGTMYFQILANTVYGGPTSIYIEDVTIVESPPVDLPIELLYFKGMKDNLSNKLFWSTASENNNDFFTIEKSINGIDWEIIDRQSGAGNSSIQLNYYSLDQSVESLINYYKLKQTDYDGKFKYSDIISIDNRMNSKSKEIDKITNILGQEIDLQYYKGLVIIYYTDGSSNKMIK